ncbi:MAG: 2-C-methyl-D-erythritol 4-phosphate cytidylyltransferase [Phascolarctobacterium sp.]|nr:2-C-methyl-D-erythritol 4-phosphate cytidylyltransferase [Phascolarctobacterium sp.]
MEHAQEKLVCIVPAAGAGKRLGLGINKAFALLRGAPLIVHCLHMLQETGIMQRAIVVLAPSEVTEGKELLARYQEQYFPRLTLQVVAGGKERQDSVANALAVVGENVEYIAVHDGARPFAGKAVFERTLAVAEAQGAAIAAVPVKNTIKVIDEAGFVVATPVRSSLVAVQTPQIFRAELLQGAYAHLAAHPCAVTDDASVVELLEQKVAIAQGRYENIKITTPEDLVLAEHFLDELAREEQEDGK